MAKRLITERDVVERAASGERTITLEAGTLVTPSARDEAKRLGLRFVALQPPAPPPTADVTVVSPKDPSSPNASIVVAIGADHGGFAMKEGLKQHLAGLGYRLLDVGTSSDQACDYPDFAFAVATLVAKTHATFGIMIDSVGVASAIAANKVDGIRAVPCYSEFVARSSREHNNANVLTLGGKALGIEHAKSIVTTWLTTPYAGGRHEARVRKIHEIEHSRPAQRS